MNKESRSIAQIKGDIKSAGQSFLGMKMADLLTRVKELDDRSLKNKLIEEYYLNQTEYKDTNIAGTRTRVNSAMRIIRAEKVIFALEQIDGSNPLVSPKAVAKAKETINKIKSGELKLPELN